MEDSKGLAVAVMKLIWEITKFTGLFSFVILEFIGFVKLTKSMFF